MTVVVKFNHFGVIAGNITPRCHTAVTNTAVIIAGKASSNAPVDTGFLQSSPYVVTNDSSTYGSIGSPVKKGAYALPEEPAPSDPCTAIIGIAANYGAYVELSTRRMRAQPYLVPAVMSSVGDFENELNKVFVL